MKKLILILTIFAFTGQELIAQWSMGGSSTIYRSGGADRASDGGGVFDTQGDWSLDATISQYTSAQALDGSQNGTSTNWAGNSHNGHGANGWGSAALGAYNRASGVGSFVAGFMNVAGPTGSRITSIPPSTTNLGGQFAVGYGTQATGHVAFSSGYSTTASATASTALGYSTTASGTYSTAIGEGSTASGSRSTAMGKTTIASDFASLVIGQYNSSGSSVTNSATVFNTANTAFVIGNGTASNAKSDAFKVMFNGDATVSNDLTVSGDVNISSDARLKSNIVSLGSTLSKLLLIDGKSYIMNKSGEEKIGILAQEVQEVFPELVSEDENEMLSVNYQGLVPVLINAVKEQEDKISRLEKLVEQLISEK